MNIPRWISCALAALFLGAFDATAQSSAPAADPQRAFDFEIGTWKTHVKRRIKPLTGSDAWVEYEGTSVVRRIWDGKANMVELDVTGPSGRIQALSLRLYDPATRKWSLNVASAFGGEMTPPAIGGFKDGRGEFFGQETLGGKPIVVRFVIHDIQPDSVKFEQAFSADGGKTWEANWIATDTRVAP